MSFSEYIHERIEETLIELYGNSVPSWLLPRGNTPFATTLKQNDWPIYQEYVDSIVQEYEHHIAEMFKACDEDVEELVKELADHGIDRQEVLYECYNSGLGGVLQFKCLNCGTEQYIGDVESKGCYECDSENLEELG